MMGPAGNLPYYLTYWAIKISIFTLINKFIVQEIDKTSVFYIIINYIM